jgi:tRNA A22 N-methylase
MNSTNESYLYDAFNEGNIATFKEYLSKINESKNYKADLKNKLTNIYNKNTQDISTGIGLGIVFALGTVFGILTSNYDTPTFSKEKCRILTTAYSLLGICGVGGAFVCRILADKQHEMINLL